MNEDPTKIQQSLDPEKRLIEGVTAHGNKSFGCPLISHIYDNIWQGGCFDGLWMPQQIEHVVSLYPWERYRVRIDQPPKSEMYYWAFDDVTQGTDLFERVAAWVCQLEGPVLVHCQAGLNRSSAVVGRVLVSKYGMTGEQAIRTLRSQRSTACLCNPAFEKFVRESSHFCIPACKDDPTHYRPPTKTK